MNCATYAYDFAAKENIQTHGGIGPALGSRHAVPLPPLARPRAVARRPMAWKDKLVSRLEQKNAA